MHPTHARQLAWLTRHPEACVHAVQVARGIPPIDLATLERIEPPRVRILLDGQLGTLQSDLAWSMRFGPDHQQGLLLVDAIHRFEAARIGSWPRLRAGVRLQSRCPAWMLVHVARPAIAAAIETAFRHQRELMPLLLGPEHPRPDCGQARQHPDFDFEAQTPAPRPRLLIS